MNLFLVKVWICLFAAVFTMYSIVEMQNQETEMRMRVPQLNRVLQRLKEENSQLRYEIELNENPKELLHLLSDSSWGYLRFPQWDEVIFLSPEKGGANEP